MLSLTGESGGGQLLRSALTLSAITGRPFRMEHIRAGRSKPGLMRQHLTCVEAAAAICGAEVEGASPGSQELVFKPGKIRSGDFRFAIGTGGSTTLVLQTVLPALLLAPARSAVSITGGTHNPMAPPADFLEKCYLPVLHTMGAAATVTTERPGFMQAGGGVLTATVEPLVKWRPLQLHERGALIHTSGRVLQAHLDKGIAHRVIHSALEILDWATESIDLTMDNTSAGPGSILMLEAVFENITELCSCVAEPHRRAENLGSTAAKQLRNYMGNTAPVGIHLADQLLLPMALAGSGSFATFALSKHTRSHMALIPEFLPVTFQQTAKDGGVVILSVHGDQFLP